DRTEHELARHAVAANEFDDDVHVRVGDHREGVVGDAHAVARHAAGVLDVLVGDDADADRPAGAPRDLFLVAAQHLESATADGADTEKAYVDWFHVRIRKRLAVDAAAQAAWRRRYWSRKRAMRPMASCKSSSCGRNT